MSNPHPTPRFVHLKDTNSVLARYILKRHPLGFLSATVTGPRGGGKSQYAYRVAAKIYMEINGYSEEEAFKEALKNIIFTTEQFTDKIDETIKKDSVIPCLVLDDCTVHFCSYEFFYNKKKVAHLHALFDLIRTSVSGLLLTAPNRDMLLSFMRKYHDLHIEIKRRNGQWARAARAYYVPQMPDGRKVKVYVPFQDDYSCYMKQEYYDPYLKKRKKAIVEMNEKMKSWREKEEE